MLSDTEAFTGRTPPHSVEAEEYLLSCCLIDGADTVAAAVEAKLNATMFYVSANRIIYEQLENLYNAGKTIDLAVLAEELRTAKRLEEVGGYSFLVQISGRIPTTAQVRYFIEKIRELYVLRELIKVSTGVVEKCYNYSGGIKEFVDRTERDIFAITQERGGDAPKHAKHALAEVSLSIRRAIEHKGELTGLSSGFADLDAFTFGFQRQEMIVLAARPSMGKTALALNIAEAAIFPKPGRPATGVLIFSLEMSAAQLVQRLICTRARVDHKQLQQGFIKKGGDEMGRIQEVEAEIAKAPLFIDDGTPTVMEIRAKARRVHKHQKLGLIVVDYLQLIAPIDARVNREQQVAEASRGLKALAKELDVPVLVLSQLNRSSELNNRAPRLSDLRESGAIEQDADVVLMLARPKDAEEGQTATDMSDLIIAKQRNGPVGGITLAFTRAITRFENFTR